MIHAFREIKEDLPRIFHASNLDLDLHAYSFIGFGISL